MYGLAPIDAVLQEMVEGTTAERAAALRPAGDQNALLASHPALFKVGPQFREAANRKVLAENQANAVGLLFIDDELAVLDVVTERDGTASRRLRRG